MSPLEPVAPSRDETAEEPTAQLCTFWVGDQEYAVDVMRLDEVLRPQKVTPVAGAPELVEGVLNLRGVIVPVIELRHRLHATAPNPNLKPRLMVCRVGRGRIALPVDGMSEIVRVKRSEIRPSPRAEAPGDVRPPIVLGVWGPPERLRLLLNVKALLVGNR